MDNLQQYLQDLNPKDPSLIYGASYRLWDSTGTLMGEATWTKDNNVGDSFQRQAIDEAGRLVTNVFIPAKWEQIKQDNEKI